MKKFPTRMLLLAILGSTLVLLVDRDNLSAILVLTVSTIILIASIIPDIPSPDC